MERRTLMIGLSGATLPLLVQAVPRLALAQANGAAPSSASLDEEQHRKATLMVGSFAKQTSQLALRRALHPGVKQFASFEDAEQTTIAQVLTSNQNPPPVPLDANEEAMLRQLQAAAGPAFDQAYVQGQIMGHQQLLGIQEAFLRGQSSMTTDAVHIALLARTVIQMHLTMLHDLERIVRT